MSRRRDLVGAWVALAVAVVLGLWLLWGAVRTATSPHPFTPATAPGSEPVIYSEEP